MKGYDATATAVPAKNGGHFLGNQYVESIALLQMHKNGAINCRNFTIAAHSIMAAVMFRLHHRIRSQG
jgi:hypothetical protein